MIKNLAFTTLAPRVAKPNDITILEARLHVALPPTFHEFCFRWNGGFPGKENCNYEVPASYKKFHDLMFVDRAKGGQWIEIDSLFGTCEEWKPCSLLEELRVCCDLEGSGSGFKIGASRPPIIPIGSNLMGGLLVLKGESPSDKVYWIDSDTFEMPEGIEWGTTPGNPEAKPALLPIAENLEEFLNALTIRPA
jgi:hypothetical protein